MVIYCQHFGYTCAKSSFFSYIYESYIMPSYDNAKRLADKIINCETEFESLFEGLKRSDDFDRELNKIKAYYRRAFNKTTSECAGEDIVDEYKYLLLTLQQVKSGNITADEAINSVEDLGDCRALDVLLFNIFKMFELLFWAAAAAACYVACISVGIPTMACNPIVGFVISASTAVLCISTIERSMNCFAQFKSYDPVEAEATREQNAVRFFAPAMLVQDEIILKEEESSSLSSSQ